MGVCRTLASCTGIGWGGERDAVMADARKALPV